MCRKKKNTDHAITDKFVEILMMNLVKCISAQSSSKVRVLTGRYFADRGGMPAEPVVTVGRLDKDGRLAETFREHLATCNNTAASHR